MKKTAEQPDPQSERRRKEELLRQCAQLKFNQEMPERLSTLISLCQPDKHGGSKMASDATTWLLNLRDQIQGESVPRILFFSGHTRMNNYANSNDERIKNNGTTVGQAKE